MFGYKGYSIYHVTHLNKWRVQCGYYHLGDYNTVGGAKRGITWDIKRG